MVRTILLSCVSGLALVTTAPLAAQSTVDPSSTTPTGSAAKTVDQARAGAASATGDIIVTARRREEALQDVPISVTAISGTQLARQGSVNIQQLPVPSFSATAQGTNRKSLAFAIRGQRSAEPQLLTDPAVGTYFAEIVQPRPFGFGNTLFDVSSIQVLKGVQGTLFGRNTTGGAILIEPNAPTRQFQAGMVLTKGNYDLFDGEAFVNLPLGDVAALRVAGKIRSRDGYVTEIDTGVKQEDENYGAVRGSLRLGFGPLVSTTIGDYLKADENGSGLIGSDYAVGKPGSGVTDANFFTRCRQPSATNGLTVIGNQQCASLGGVATPIIQQYQASMARLAAGGPLTFDSGRGGRLDAINRPLFSNLKNWGVTNRTTYAIGPDLTLKNIAGYRKIDFDRYQDLDGIPAFLINSIQGTRVKEYSEEFQLQGAANSNRLKYTLGLYYFQEKGTEVTGPSSQFPELTILGAIAAGAPLNPFTAPASIFTLFDTAYTDAKSSAAYAAATYKLTDQLSVAGGIRYSHDKKQATLTTFRGTSCTFDPDGAGPGAPLPANACFRSNRTSNNALTWDATLQYEPSDALTAYLSTRRGYRAGGLNLRAKSDAEFQPFLPEHVQEYEVGLKNKFIFSGGTMRTALAIFYQDYKNVQKSVPLLSNGAIITVVNNTSAQENYGGELEAGIDLNNGISLSAYYSYVNAKIKKYGDPSLIGSFALIGVPKHQAGFNLGYRPRILAPGNGDISLNANVSYKGRQHLDDRDVSGDERAYTLVNLSADWDNIANSGVGVGVFANNVFNKRYRVGVISLLDAVGIQASIYGEPAMYGARLKFRFH